MLLRKKIIIVSGSSATLLGGALAIPFFGNFKATSFKEQLIRKGYKPVTNWPHKISSVDTSILDSYGVYKTNKDGLQEFNLVKWCKEHEGKTEDNPALMKQVEEICFETVHSELRRLNKRIIEKQENREWEQKWQEFKQNKENFNNSSHWNLRLESNTVPEEFKEKCKENSRKPFTDKNRKLFNEVEKYCSTTWIPTPPKD